MAHLKSFRRAFTLIELLVVITIIGILIGMLVPAVNAAREAARRLYCTNNIKQLVLAMNTYHTQLSYFPPNRSWSTSAGTDADGNDVVGESWLVGVLPFIEERSLYDTIQVGQGLNATNLVAAKRAVAAFRCPSELGDGTLSNQPTSPQLSTGGAPLGVTSYKGCSGANWEGTYPSALYKYRKQDAVPPLGGRNADNYNGRDYGDGLMCRGYRKASDPKMTPVSAFEVSRDGMSNTIAIGECIPQFCGWSAWWWWQGTTATCAMPINYEEPTAPRNTNASGSSSWKSNMGFASRHSGIALFGLCDGSARSISQQIDQKVFRALGTIDGGEIIPADY